MSNSAYFLFSTVSLPGSTSNDGTALSIEHAEELNKPNLIVDLSENPSVDTVIAWIRNLNIGTLNVSGPRESQCPGIQIAALQFLSLLFERLMSPAVGPNEVPTSPNDMPKASSSKT